VNRPPTRLSPHFLLREFDGRDGALAPLDTVSQYRALCRDWLEPVRAEFGETRILSGYRSVSHNKAVGGAPQSFHVARSSRIGVAADFTCARGRPRQWYDFLDKLGAPGLGIYSTHVHVDNRATRARW